MNDSHQTESSNAHNLWSSLRPFKRMLTTHIAILNATEGDDLLAARSLFQQYRRLFGGEDLEKEGIAQEIAGLPWVYQQPYGDLLVARVAGLAAGCIALRTRAHQEGELKR